MADEYITRYEKLQLKLDGMRAQNTELVEALKTALKAEMIKLIPLHFVSAIVDNGMPAPSNVDFPYWVNDGLSVLRATKEGQDVEKIKFIPQQYNELIQLAKHISNFKTKEMELVFAELIQRYIQPPCIINKINE